MRNPLRARRGLRLRELSLVVALLLTVACGGAHTLAPLTAAPQSSAAISWLSPVQPRDAVAVARWRSAVGSPIVTSHGRSGSDAVSDALTIVSWNIALDGGDVVRLVRELQTHAPDRPLVLLLQEAFRSGDDVPPTPLDGAFAGHLGRSTERREIDDVARELGFSLYYVPSMRNGLPGKHAEDRGNAVLSSIPLDGHLAIELPFERQRRVAVAARISGRTSHGQPWSLRLVNVHLDNLASFRYGFLGSEWARARQARGLITALNDGEPTVLAGDFNTWFGFSDQVYMETARAFPQTSITDTRRTFRGMLRLDHVFYRVSPGWQVNVRRGESSLGSDHYPLITTISFDRASAAGISAGTARSSSRF